MAPRCGQQPLTSGRRLGGVLRLAILRSTRLLTTTPWLIKTRHHKFSFLLPLSLTVGLLSPNPSCTNRAWNLSPRGFKRHSCDGFCSFLYGSLHYLYCRQHGLEGRLALGWYGQSLTLDRPLSKWADRLSLRLINISEFRLFYFCGRQRTLLQDDVVLTPLQFSTFGTWHPADPALSKKLDMDIHRSATASSSLSKSEEFAYEGRCSLANIA